MNDGFWVTQEAAVIIGAVLTIIAVGVGYLMQRQKQQTQDWIEQIVYQFKDEILTGLDMLADRTPTKADDAIIDALRKEFNTLWDLIFHNEKEVPPAIAPPKVETPQNNNEGIDLLPYIKGDGRVYDVTFNFPGNQWETGIERMQTQDTAGARFYHVKGGMGAKEYKWEELWSDEQYIYRGTDTSPGPNELYQTHTNGTYGMKWLKRRMNVGDRWFTAPTITFRHIDTGKNVEGKAPYVFPHWLEVKAVHPVYTFENGVSVNDVLEIWGYLADGATGAPGANFERYFYAKMFGLVGWQAPDKNWRSYLSNPNVGGIDHLPRLNIGSTTLPII